MNTLFFFSYISSQPGLLFSSLFLPFKHFWFFVCFDLNLTAREIPISLLSLPVNFSKSFLLPVPAHMMSCAHLKSQPCPAIYFPFVTKWPVITTEKFIRSCVSNFTGALPDLGLF